MAEARLGLSALTPQYRWNPIALRYIKPDGTFVPFVDLREALQKVQLAGTDLLLGHSVELARGNLTVSEWQRRMASDIKVQHLAAAAANRGGWAQLTQGDKRWIGRQTKAQLKFLGRFAGQIASGDQDMDGKFMARTEMYGEAASQTGKAMLHRVADEGGMQLEKNMMGQAEHSPDCIRESGRGWVTIGSLTLPGKRDCLTRCQCRLIYKREGEADAA